MGVNDDLSSKNFGQKEDAPSATSVNDFHTNSDVDSSPEAQHHTIGRGPNKVASGDHIHNGEDAPLLLEGIIVSGSLTGGDALKSLLTALAAWGLQDETTA